MSRIVALVALAAALLAGSGASAVAAQERCDAPRRSLAELGALLVERGEGQPLPDAVPYVPPAGDPADAATAADVRALIGTMVACGNAGDIVGLLSLFTDDFIQRHADLGLINEVPDGAYVPEPLPAAERLTLIDVRDVTVTGDGEMRALVVFEQENPSPEGLTHQVTLVRAGTGWLIDAVQPVTLPATGSSSWRLVSGDGYQGVILPVNEVEEFVRWFGGDVVQGAWVPTEEQIATLEAALPAFLRGSSDPRIADELAEYRRQYAGYVADGRALIVVNAFCDPTGSDWQSEPVIVLDGGDCYWSVVWDPTAGAFERLSVNGEA